MYGIWYNKWSSCKLTVSEERNDKIKMIIKILNSGNSNWLKLEKNNIKPKNIIANVIQIFNGIKKFKNTDKI